MEDWIFKCLAKLQIKSNNYLIVKWAAVQTSFLLLLLWCDSYPAWAWASALGWTISFDRTGVSVMYGWRKSKLWFTVCTMYTNKVCSCLSLSDFFERNLLQICKNIIQAGIAPCGVFNLIHIKKYTYVYMFPLLREYPILLKPGLLNLHTHRKVYIRIHFSTS